ncbi:MAG: hemerythrin domain-containing protein [Methanoregulaceae archaeon]|jgi:hemerythrin-like domain-containing protein|nr:hemerythrin domain-containing protein [Methanoregulaceae archaeon]
MVEPVDGIRVFHNAFRNDITRIDTAALESARGKTGQDTEIKRYRFYNEVLDWHAKGEELAVFPAVEKVAPLVAEAYLKDHHGLDAAYRALDRAYSAHDLLETARATAAFRFHLNMHLGKEDSHLYRIFRERIPVPDQVKVLTVMAGSIPRERFPEVVAWLYPLISPQDRETMTRIWQNALPPPLFVGAKELIRKAIGSDDWAELTRRIPDL